MPGSIGKQNNSYPFLSRFSTGTLRQLLREDFASKEPSTPESDSFITCVAEVIARREAADPGVPQFDVEAGWRSFSRDSKDAGAAVDGAAALEADLSRMAAQWNQELLRPAGDASENSEDEANALPEDGQP